MECIKCGRESGSRDVKGGTGDYFTGNNLQLWAGGSTFVNGTWSISASITLTGTFIFDLVNKTAYYDLPGIKTETYTLTDSQIAAIKTDALIYIPQSNNTYIKDVYIKVE